MIWDARNGRMLFKRLRYFVADVDWRHAIREVWWVLMLPFRLVASIWRFGGAVGRFIISGAIELCVVVLGLLFFLMFSFGMIRALLHPLFQ
jgi:hypothetical protein